MLYLILAIEDPQQRNLLLDLYLEHKGAFLRYAMRILHDQQSAEDIVQDVFAKLVENPAILKYDEVGKNAPYVYVMIKNHCLNYINRNKKDQPIEDIDIPHEVDFAEMLSTQEHFQMAVETIMGLPENYKDVIMLRYGNGLSDNEISKYLQITPGNVRVRVCRALASLQKRMAKEGKINAG